MSDKLGNLFFVLLAVFSIVISAITFTFNLAIIIIMITTRRCQTVSNLLVCSSCVAAIVFSMLALVVSVYCMREDWAFEQPACVGKALLFVWALSAFTYSYSMQAVSRLFFAVFYKHRVLLTWRTHWIMIGCNWAVSLLVPIGLLLIGDGLGLERESRLCLVSSKVLSAATWCVVIIFCIPLSVVVTIYAVIYHHARRSARRVIPATSNIHLHNTGHQARRERKLAQLLVLQTGSFACGGIIYSINILWQALSHTPLPVPLYSIGFNLITFFMPFAGINQFLLNKPMRDAAMKYLRRCCWIKKIPIVTRLNTLRELR